MTDQNAAPAADAAPGPIDYAPPADTQEALSIDDAMRLLSEPPKEKQEAESAEPAKAATAEQESTPQGEDGDQETDPAEQQTQADEPEAELPPIEPPRSWTKEEKEAFAKWPREAQESISRVASTREAEFRRSQNEAAEARKAIEAELGKAKQLQTEYETKLPQLVKTLETALQNDFADIQTMNDVRKLQAEDPFRFQQWQLRQMELAEAHRQNNEVAAREESDRATKWTDHVQKENAAFIDSLSDADKGKINDRLRAAPEFLEARGFTKQELTDLASGKERLSIYDHRIQSLILDGMKYREIQNAPKAVAKPNLPPVQRPGAKQPASAAKAQSIQALNQQLSATGSIDDALALLMAQRKAS